jgi:putative salt-induced outer membrane protein YdiY
VVSESNARGYLKYDRFLTPKQEVLVGIADVKKAFAKTSTGLRMPVANKITTTVQCNLDWENEPAPGRVHTDQAALLTLGYQF